MLIIPSTSDPSCWGSPEARLRPIRPSLGTRVNPDESSNCLSLMATHKTSKSKQKLYHCCCAIKSWGELEKRWRVGNIVRLHCLNIHVMFEGNDWEPFIYVFAWEIVLKSTRLNWRGKKSLLVFLWYRQFICRFGERNCILFVSHYS